jgi:DNA-binding transcriptional LysR family regulator
MDNELDLSALRVYCSVVREGSFTAAARILSTPKSTVSKRVHDLERQLGVRLIERTTRQMRVTAEGEVLAARADRLLCEAENIRRAMTDSGSTPKGHLRIAVPQLFGQIFLGPVAAACRARFPEITLEFVYMDRPPDLIEEGYDGAIRFGPLEDSGQVARKLTEAYSVVVAAPSLMGIADLIHPDDLARLPQIAISPAWPGNWKLHRGGEEITFTPEPVLLVGSVLTLHDCAVRGAGVALMPSFLAQPDIDAGRLVRLLPDWRGMVKELYFVYPSPQSATARLRAFLSVLNLHLDRLDKPSAPPSAVSPFRP